MSKKTQTTRISSWVYNLFSSKAEKDETTFLKKLDEVAESLHLLDVEEVVLNSFLNEAYKTNTSNTSRYVFEALNGLMNYSMKLNMNTFNKYSFKQFIDRWNIVAYYIASHVYTNVLSKSSLSDDELKHRANSTVALAFLFDKNVNNVIECLNEVMKEIDPYENAYMSGKSKSLILTKIFENKQLMNYLESELIVRKEAAIASLFNELSNDLKTDGKSAYTVSIDSFGLTNKLAYLIYIYYRDGQLTKLPFFVNETFINDLFSLLHNTYLHQHSSDLYYAKALESAFVISEAIMKLDAYHAYDDSYLKSNLEHSNQFEKLKDAISADIDSLKYTTYTYSAEMRMRTPLHIIGQTTKMGVKYVLRPDIQKVIIEHLINICYPLFFQIREVEGEVLHFRDSKLDSKFYAEDNSAQIAISMKEDFYYANLIIYVQNEKDGILSTITIYMKHSSLEKIYHCLKNNDSSTTKIEDKLSIYDDSKDSLQLFYSQGCVFLHGKAREAFINVVKKYVESKEFVENKKFDILNYGLI